MHSPKPYFTNLKKVKAILLGADPSNNSDKGKAVQLEYVFGIGEKDKRYFAGIEKNLAEIDLKREDIYAQNLVQEYQPVETGKNKKWKETAEPWVEILKQELDAFDPGKTIPVLVTASVIFTALTDKELPEPKAIYLSQAVGIVKPDENRLGRKLLPFYRHYRYTLGKEAYKAYREVVKGIVWSWPEEDEEDV
jgi:hypothetical protein